MRLSINVNEMPTGRAIAIAFAILLAACSGGGGGGSTSGGGGGGGPTLPTLPLHVDIKLAQTHVLAPSGKSWTLGANTTQLHFVGGKPALALVRITETDATNPIIEGYVNGALQGSVTLNPPSALPTTDGGGAAMANNLYSATVPANWLRPGLTLVARANNYLASSAVAVDVGADASMAIKILPFYLFGANEANSVTLANANNIPEVARKEALAKWPFATMSVAPLSTQAISWPYIVVAPRTSSANVAEAAYRATSSTDYKDGYAGLSAVLNITNAIKNANGDANTASAYYASLLALNVSTGRLAGTGGGLAYTSQGAASGDHVFRGVFFHELGHGFSLNHAGEAYAAGNFPYVGGSLNGSEWGWDPDHNQLLSPLIPATASSFAKCASSHSVDANGACFKQDPMQGGSGDQDPSYYYTMHADFYVGQIQKWLEGVTTLDTAGKHVFNGGRIFGNFGNYVQWDSIDKAWVALPADATQDGGLYGVNRNLPTNVNVPVYTIVTSVSFAGTANATQIYPPIAYNGNLIRTFDPSNAADRAAFTPNTGTYYWYCRSEGCDYTLKIFYKDGTVAYRALKGAFRSWFGATNVEPASASNPTDSDSFRVWAINVPQGAGLSRIELYRTPMVWQGLPASPTLLAARDIP